MNLTEMVAGGNDMRRGFDRCCGMNWNIRYEV
jgi:hypothetical protein